MISATALIIDPREKYALPAARSLSPEGLGLLIANDDSKARDLLRSCRPEIVIVDALASSPDLWLTEIQTLNLAAQLVAVVDEPDFDQAMTWIHEGVFNVLSSPLEGNKMLKVVKSALKQCQLFKDILQSREAAPAAPAAPLFESDQLMKFYQTLPEFLEVKDLGGYLVDAVPRLLGAKYCELQLSKHFSDPGLFTDSKSFRNYRPAQTSGFTPDCHLEKGGETNLDLRSKGRYLGRLILTFDELPDFGSGCRLEEMASVIAAALYNACQYQKIVNLASRDALTGLYNRRVFTETLKREYAEAVRYGHALSLLILDLDHFKAVNDNFGHQTGDEVLKNVARIIAQAARSIDIPARIGGEEFAVILPHTTQDQAFFLAERLKKSLAEDNFSPETALVRQTISQGVVGLEHFMVNSVEDLIYWADQALYLAKREGRDTIRTASDLPLKTTTFKDSQYAFQ